MHLELLAQCSAKSPRVISGATVVTVVLDAILRLTVLMHVLILVCQSF